MSISTIRAKPMPPGLSQGGMEEAAGAGFGCAAAFGAEPLGATGVVACATRVGAAFGAAGAVAGVASATSIGAAAGVGAGSPTV